MLKKIGLFEETQVYESSLFKVGHGLTIPQIGIIIYPELFRKMLI